jgi:hypothetical protein
MRTLKAALRAAACAIALAAAAQAQSAGPPAAADLPMLMRGPMPAVEVMVNGKGPFLFAIDTGAQGRARVDASLVERLGLQASGQAMGTDGSGRPGRAMAIIRLDSIQLGPLRFEQVDALSRDYNTSPNMPKIDGILAFGLFADHLLTLDYPARRVRVSRGELPPPDGKEILGYETSRGTPVVELGVGGEKIGARVDTGNAVGAVILPTSLVEKLAHASEPVVVGRARTVAGETEIKQVRLKDTVRLGGFEYKEPTVVFPALSDEANVGSLLLRDFVVTFDQKNKRMRLERREPSGQAAEQPLSQPARSSAGAAASTPRALSPAELAAYAGVYGERTITAEGGALHLRRTGGPKLKLIPAGADEFTVEGIPNARVKFVKGESGRVTAVQVLNRAGEWEKSERTQ